MHNGVSGAEICSPDSIRQLLFPVTQQKGRSRAMAQKHRPPRRSQVRTAPAMHLGHTTWRDSVHLRTDGQVGKGWGRSAGQNEDPDCKAGLPRRTTLASSSCTRTAVRGQVRALSRCAVEGATLCLGPQVVLTEPPETEADVCPSRKELSGFDCAQPAGQQ